MQSQSDFFKTLDHIPPLLKISWLWLAQLRKNSSAQPSRSYIIWLLLLLCCTHSDPAKLDSLSLFDHRRHAADFALAGPSNCNTLLPYMTRTLPSHKSFFKCHPLRLTLIILFTMQQGPPFPFSPLFSSRVSSNLLNDWLISYVSLHSQGQRFLKCFVYWYSPRTKNCG